MYTDFKTYWELKSSMYEKLGVTKDVAYQIWCDAADMLKDLFVAELTKQYK